MDLSLLTLLAMLAGVAWLQVHLHRRMSRERRWASHQMFGLAFGGLLLLGAGLAGADLRHGHGWLRGVVWGDGRVWWEVGFGAALLAVAAVLARSRWRRAG